ncbi:MAG TPA: hypothetical protein G4O11_00130 [Anaerolineae bacterium]|nr:hypothetical protein [Anaerolineae bacterium]
MLRKYWLSEMVVCITLILGITACGPLSPPESCGAGGTADEAAFAQHFKSMGIVNQATGSPGEPDPEGGYQFSSSDQLALTTDSITDTSLRACIEERRGGGKIVFDQTPTMSQGTASMPLGSFEPGSYVVRVILDGVLVRNLPFSIK